MPERLYTVTAKDGEVADFVVKYADQNGNAFLTREAAVKSINRVHRKREIKGILGYLSAMALIVMFGMDPLWVGISVLVFLGIVCFAQWLQS